MLVLSRKPGERILIGSDIVVTIVRFGPNTCRVGIEAPQHVNIVREELNEQQCVAAIVHATSETAVAQPA